MENKIMVFGGTGGVGQIIVQKLVDNGENVCVLTRQSIPSKPNLTYKLGNVLDIESVEKFTEQDDNVIIALGFNNSSLDTMSKGTANIISAMKKNGAKRIICLSAQGAGDSWEDMPDEFRTMVLNDTILKASFHDHGIQEDLVKNSDLKWTIVRPTEITIEREKGSYTKNRTTKESIFQISKFDVAQFIIDELNNDEFIRQVVMITN
jgi:putative NADH-flavin reductase